MSQTNPISQNLDREELVCFLSEKIIQKNKLRRRIPYLRTAMIVNFTLQEIALIEQQITQGFDRLQVVEI